MKKKLERLRERAHQLKEKRPGYGQILDFYVKVKEAQVTSRKVLKLDPIKLKKGWKSRPTEKDFPLIRKEDFPLDVEASISLFNTLCQIGKTANPHMAEQVEKVEEVLNDSKMDLEKVLTGRGKQPLSEQLDAHRGLDKEVLSFLIQNSIRPSIEAGVEQLRGELDPEKWRKSLCPICGSPPSLSLLKGEEGKRYSLCSYCSFEWRIDRLSCAVCGNEEQQSLSFFCGEGEEAYRIDLCDKCHHYIKTIDYRTLEPSDPCLEDLATLHLDVVAAQKGYRRAVLSYWSA
jgi:FdhE protein